MKELPNVFVHIAEVLGPQLPKGIIIRATDSAVVLGFDHWRRARDVKRAISHVEHEFTSHGIRFYDFGFYENELAMVPYQPESKPHA